tara:strand:- start:52508 stop:53506 length:999 start_codon:yes stop_codon:yes gene_type:complete
MNLKNKKIALIGGAGFIGHNLAISLKKSGANVFVFDSLQVNNLGEFSCSVNSNNKNLYISFLNQRLNLLRENKIDIHVVDARDYFLLTRHLTNIKFDVTIFLAAVAHAGKANKDPYNTFDHSLRTLENSLDALRETNTHFIYFSSSMVYGNFKKKKVSEKDDCNPLGIYGALKYSGEKLVTAYGQVFNMNYTIIRPSALYGERCVSRRVSQIFVENAIESRNLIVDGDGSESLDFTYIDDLIEGVKLVVENKKSSNKIFNLTYGKSEKIIDLAKLIASEFKVKIKFKKRDKLMPFRGTLDIKEAKNILGYKPRYSIYNGVKKYIEWYKNFKK